MRRGNKTTRDFACKSLTLIPRNRSGVISEYLPWLLIGIAVLVVIMISIFLLKGKGLEFIDSIKNIFKGG